MPVLNDAKRERFAQLIARGAKIVEAYEMAGYKRNTGNATSLRKREDVSQRIAEIQREMANNSREELQTFLRESGITQTYIIRQLLDTAQEAKKANRFDVAAKCFKDVGSELFAMFTNKTQSPVDNHDDLFTPTNRTLDLTRIHSALENLTVKSSRLIEEARDASAIDPSRSRIPTVVIEHD